MGVIVYGMDLRKLSPFWFVNTRSNGDVYSAKIGFLILLIYMVIILAAELDKDNRGRVILEPETFGIKLLGDNPTVVACCLSAYIIFI